MILQPLFPWWALMIVFIPIIGFCGWLIVVNGRQRKIWIRRLVTILLILLVFLRPSLPGAPKNTGTALLDVFFVVDATYSAKALDYNGNQERIDGIKQDIKAITEKLVGARFSVIVFDNSAYIALPLTSDTSTVASAADLITVQHNYNSLGSSIDMPLETTEKELARTAKATPERGRVLFYMGDGEQTADSEPKSFASLKEYVKGGAVLGYGTTAGGKMRSFYWGTNLQYGAKEFISDTSVGTVPYPDALSKIDESNLRNIAEEVGIEYVHRTQPGNIDQVTQAIDVGDIIRQSKDVTSYDDISWMATPLILLLVSFDVARVYTTARELKLQHRRSKA